MPRESGFIDGAFSSATSSVVNRIAAAPILSTMYVICVVPEMGTIQGFCTISHDSAICGNSLFPHGTSLHKLHERQISSQILCRRLWLILIAIHFDRPKEMRERELGELPLAVFLDINLSHHKRIGEFVLTDCCLQINVL